MDNPWPKMGYFPQHSCSARTELCQAGTERSRKADRYQYVTICRAAMDPKMPERKREA